MSGWGRALMSMLGDQKAERTERDSLIERYGGKAGQEGVPSAPIYGQIGGDYGSMEGPNEGTGEGGATDEMKAQAKSAKAFRDLGQHLYGYSREELSTKSLGELRGLARKEESAIVQQEKTQARQDRLAQFAEVQKQHQIAEERNWKNDSLDALYRHQQNMRGLDADLRADAQAKLAAQIHADTQARYATGQQDAETQRGAVGGFLRDFNQFAEGPQFNGTGMQRPMGQFEAYRQAAGANPRAFTPQMMDDLGRMAVSEDRLGAGRGAAAVPSVFTDPNGNQWVQFGNNPLQRSKTEEQIAAELAARGAPRAMAPEGSVPGVLNGVKVLVGPDGRIYKMPAVNPFLEMLSQGGQGAPNPSPTVGSKVSDWWNNRGASQPATNAPTGGSKGAEVERTTSDGRRAIFDETTKKFLRYAN